jgi:hypothetical protein
MLHWINEQRILLEMLVELELEDRADHESSENVPLFTQKLDRSQPDDP